MGAAGGLLPARSAAKKEFDSPEKCKVEWKRTQKPANRPWQAPRRRRLVELATKWIVTGVALFLLLGLGRFHLRQIERVDRGRNRRARAVNASHGRRSGRCRPQCDRIRDGRDKIELASKSGGRVLWIGVEKGDQSKAGQTLVRLEDDEYRRRCNKPKGGLQQLEARLEEAVAGSRPEEIAAPTPTSSNQSGLENAKTTSTARRSWWMRKSIRRVIWMTRNRNTMPRGAAQFTAAHSRSGSALAS